MTITTVSAPKRIKILLVEDNLPDIMLVEEALQEHNVDADLEVLRDGDAAYHYWDRFADANASAECPDLLLLDLNLPKRSGLDVLEHVRHLPGCSHIRIIITSSSASPIEMEQAQRLGISHYFRKPTHFEEFLKLGRLIKTYTGPVQSGVAATAVSSDGN